MLAANLTRCAAPPPVMLAALILLQAAGPAAAADWPMWRYDAARTAASPEELPARLHLQWVREYPPQKPAWPDQPKMQLDAVGEPVVLGKTLFVGSARWDCVTALDVETGAEKWRFFADGPVRYAPVAWEGKLYFAADDGYLYCLDAAQGALVWKFRGGPSDRKVLGNERLVSTWPARGAPVVADGTVYFAASIWPFMGIFLHALDARTGAVRWTNDGDGSLYMKQPHNADSFAGVAPQGPLVVQGDVLLLPGGRSLPACYDRKTGKLLRYQLAENGKRGGGSDVAVAGNCIFNGGAAFDLVTEKYLGEFPKQPVLTGKVAYGYAAGELRAYDLRAAGVKTAESVDRKGDKTKVTKWTVPQLAACKLPPAEVLIKAGPRVYAGSANQVAAVEFPGEGGKAPAVVWQADVEGTPASLVAAAGRLFAVTRQGRIYCFGADKTEPKTHPWAAAAPDKEDAWTAKAREVLDATKVRAGYGVAWGAGTGRLVTELARQSDLRLVVVEPDAKKVRALRERLVAADLYGERVAVHQGDPLAFPLPPYLASLMVAEDLAAAGVGPAGAFAAKAFFSLRPFGGVAWLPVPGEKRGEFTKAVAGAGLANAKLAEAAGGVLLSREGALPGSGNWTHEHADAANTRVSKDKLVLAPLGVLWFGGPSHDGILPRHGHGPQPQVIDGRLLIEGVDMLRAMDIYTGRVLWEARLPGVGAFYSNLAHQPGANSSGTNYISTSDGIYVAYGRACVRLDPATGRKTAEFKLPAAPDAKEPPAWGYLNVLDDFLIAGADPLFDPNLAKFDPKPPADDDTVKIKLPKIDNDNLSSSKQLVVLDRHSGKVLWTAASKCGGFRHNAVCAGGGRLYCIDRLSGPEVSRLKRRGEEPKAKPRLLAFDLRTGKELWSTEADVFGTWLSYSAEHDVLVESGRVARDTISDEPKGMRAYAAGTGKVLWFGKGYAGPAMIHGDTILKDQSACDLLTGAPKMRTCPLTGRPVEWSWSRNYGCNTPAASEHLLTFRSGAAGYFDLCHDGGTGNFGGFRSSCTNNLVVAGGLLTAPDYTRTCICNYQNQTSLALVPMPEAEMWTSFGSMDVRGPVRRVGVNFGAPGDRKADDGTLWLEHPSVGGKSPAVEVRVEPNEVEYFRRHASQVEGGLAWVAASGVKGVSSVAVALAEEGAGERAYTVRLHFMEPDGLKPGERLFGVSLQGQEVLKDFDIVREAKGPNRALVKEFKGVKVTQELKVEFAPGKGLPVLCGLEVVAEGK